jgi:hypothetical protein
MGNFDEQELDNGLRRVVEGKSVEPPPSLWPAIRITTLERQLIGYQSAALWFKGTIGILAALLGGTGYFLYKANTILPIIKKEIVTVINKQVDTVYVTKIEKVYINRPLINVEKKLNTQRQILSNVTNGQRSNLSVIDNQQSKNNQIEPITKSDFQTTQSASSNTQPQEQTRKTSNFKLQANNSEPTSILNFPNIQIDCLEPLQMQPADLVAIPKIKYQLPQIKTQSPKIKIPFVDRLSLSVYASPEWNAIDVRRNDPKAFNYGDEHLQIGLTAGLRMDVQVARKWSLRTGLEYGITGFDDRNRRQLLVAENIDGRLGYLYRTALGTVEIPANRLSAQAQVGSVVGVEVQQPIQRYVLNVPLSVRYDAWAKPFRLLNQVPMKVNLYGLVGGYWQIPIGQKGAVQIFEDSGREFTSDLSSFQNSRTSYGISLGFGAELGVGRRFSLFVEPNFSKGISSVAKNMPIRSTISNFGTKIGLKWYLGR